MPTVCHFEIPADDIERAKNFYSKLFGWEIKKFEKHPNYWIFSTKSPDGKPGITGAIEKRKNVNPNIMCNICVDSIDKYIARVEELGGKVLVPKSAVPGVGYYSYCVDTEGNHFVIWETDANAG